MGFRYKLMQFMSGRYGVDTLFYVLFAISAALSVANLFIGSLILQLFIDVIIIYSLFRVMSRNVYARKRENQLFSRLAFKLSQKQKIRSQRKADYTHIYKKCPKCSAVLRLPRRKGKHTTVCPKCGHEFKVHVFKA